MSVLEIDLGCSYRLEVPGELFIPVGMGNIETYLPDSSDINKCFNPDWIRSWLPPGTYCDEPYLIHYRLNDHFPRHRDLKVSDDHLGAVLLYPPADYEGGELVIYNDDGSILHKVGCHHKDNKIIMVLVPLSYEHEVLPITKGNRYVYLAPWYREV